VPGAGVAIDNEDNASNAAVEFVQGGHGPAEVVGYSMEIVPGL
jgi:hypothetical protein